MQCECQLWGVFVNYWFVMVILVFGGGWYGGLSVREDNCSIEEKKKRIPGIFFLQILTVC